MIREETLRKKGWSEKDITQAMSILAKKREVFFTDKFAPIIYWGSLLIIIAGNLFVSIILMPFLLYLTKTTLVIVALLVAATFGALFDILVKDIKMTDPRHHVLLSIFLPIFVLINIYVMMDVANYFIKINSLNSIQNLQSPILISIIYAAGFVMPSIIDRTFSKDTQQNN